MKISTLDYTTATSYSKSMIKKNVDQFKRSLVRTSQRITPINRKDPDELFGHLFHEVQAQQIYQDGKTFVDVVPKKRWRRIQREYLEASKKPDFNLQEFVNQHFHDFNPSHAAHIPQPAESARHAAVATAEASGPQSFRLAYSPAVRLHCARRTFFRAVLLGHVLHHAGLGS